jgi:hypothetical protein
MEYGIRAERIPGTTLGIWLRRAGEAAAEEGGGGALALDLFDLGLGRGNDALGQGGEEVIGRGVVVDETHLTGEPEIAN